MSQNACCPSHHCCPSDRPTKSRRGIVSSLLGVVASYLILVFMGGTAIQSGHPVAMEAGQIVHLLTFVDPLVDWTNQMGFDFVANSIEYVAGGFPIQRYV